MAGVEQITVEAGEAGMRLDRWFKAHYPGLGFGQLQKLLRSGQVRVDGGRAKADTRVEPGQVIRVPPLAADRKGDAPLTAKTMRGEGDGEVLSRMLLYEDPAVFVFDKPAGLAVQGGSGVARHVDGMLEAFRNRKGEKPRLVHRLDRDTSGVLVVARSRLAAMKLAEAFRGRDARKTYWALVKGVPKKREDRISTWLVKEQTRDGDRMRVARHGEEGRTTPSPTTASSIRRGRRSPGWRWSPIPAAPTSFASMPRISAAQSSAIRNISRPTPTGSFPAASRTGCISMPGGSSFRIRRAA